MALLLGPGLELPAHAQPNPTPGTLIEKAIAASKDTSSRTRYTYFKLDHLKNSYREHVFFGKRTFVDTTTLYEFTWIGDLPYGRVVEVQGRPLTGEALAQEQARYDQAVADHSGLGVVARAKINHMGLIGSDIKLTDLLTPAYRLTEIRQETIDGHLTHVIDCVPIPSTDTLYPAATRHAQLWITDSGAILRKTFDVLADEPELLRGSHVQFDSQLINGDLVPLHDLVHVYFFLAPRNAVIVLDGESTYTRYRRFNVTTRILPAGDQPVGTSVRQSLGIATRSRHPPPRSNLNENPIRL